MIKVNRPLSIYKYVENNNIVYIDFKNKQIILDKFIYENIKQYPIYISKKSIRLVTNGRKNRMDFELSRYIMNCYDNTLKVDHINLNKLDNRKENLRIVTHQQNMFNCKSKSIYTKYKGITPIIVKNRITSWCARLVKDDIRISIGTFHNEEEAAKAWDNEARLHEGKFGRYNFPLEGEQCAINPNFNETERNEKYILGRITKIYEKGGIEKVCPICNLSFKVCKSRIAVVNCCSQKCASIYRKRNSKMNKSGNLENSQNLKLMEERLAYLEKKYDDVEKRVRDVELENHRLENLIKLHRTTSPTYEELYV